ncbi:MAG: amidinotransferase [Candidatus Zixiibacteriota bacterium]|nr:MAG: amidinotransferase [candidate division Zixibacteria bacterium]
MKIGCQSEYGKIERLMLKHPKDAYINQDSIDKQWEKLNYTGPTDYKRAVIEYDNFVALLKGFVHYIEYLPQGELTGLDSIYVHDSVLVTREGAILCNMGKGERGGEPGAVAEYFKAVEIPVLGGIEGNGRLEGGDVVWLDDRTMAVGEGYRTNAEGIRQLKELTSSLVYEFFVVPLPHWRGPEHCLHLMSMISPVDRDLAVIYPKMMPVPFRQWLLRRGMTLIEVPDSEYGNMACNVLAVEPRKCIMLSGNPITRGMLEEAGAEVFEIDGDEICHKGAGGPTCLTRPILRV